MPGDERQVRRDRGAFMAAGTMLGAGMGGFFDGILLHQVLQWHNMLSSVVPPTDLVAMKYNMFWDGLFHAGTWLLTLLGLIALWRAARTRDLARWSSRAFAGSLLFGWGLFNTVEGLVDHLLLGVHHVHPGRDQLAWDVGFLLSGVALCLGGLALVRPAAAGQGSGSISRALSHFRSVDRKSKRKFT